MAEAHRERNLRLWDAWKAGDAAARDALVLANLPLALGIARRLARRWGRVDREDAEQAATLALLVAVGRWEPARGALSTVVDIAARRAVRQASFDRFAVGVPQGFRGRARSRWASSRRGRILDGTLARGTVPVEDCDLASREPAAEDVAVAGEAAALVDALPADEARAVRWYYGIGGERLVAREIGARIGRSRQSADAIVHAGVGRLRTLLDPDAEAA
jgi:RNA polymerase sigma factor (sigma-70 family)